MWRYFSRIVIPMTTAQHSVFHSPLIRGFFNVKLHNQPAICEKFHSSHNVIINSSFQRAYSSASTCWNCKAALDKNSIFFCKNCGSVKKIDKAINYFNLLGIEAKFDLNITEVTTKFRELQGTMHPDKFSNKSKEEQEYSLEWSSLLNKAYKTLSTPFERGEYILKLKGYEISESNTSYDNEFLTDMMERNEEVEDAETYEEMQELLVKLRKDFQVLVSEFGKFICAEDLENARRILIKMKYLLSIEMMIKEKSLTLQQ